MILLDTHTLLWLDWDDPTLGRAARTLIHDAENDGLVAASAVTFWESTLLWRKQRIALRLDPSAWREELIEAGLVELVLDGGIAVAAARLDLHKDPADRFIVATALAYDATLVTADERLLGWAGPLKRKDART